MRKVTKILAKLLSAIVMLLIILPLSASIALTFPWVQNFVVRQAAQVASQSIGARVDIGEVRFSMLRDVELHDILIEDLGGDTMLVAKRASAHISVLSLLSKELKISDVTLSQGALRFRETSSGELNIKEITDKLTNADKESEFLTQIEKIKVSDVDFSLKRLAITKNERGVDFNSIELNGIDAVVKDLIIESGITQLKIDQLTCREQSGLNIKSLQGDFTTYEAVLDFVDLRILTDSSWINLPRLRLESANWDDFSNFEESVSIEISSEGSRLALSDVAYFSPQLWGKSFEARNLDFVANGTINNLESRISQLTYGENSNLAATINAENIVDVANARFSVEVEELSSNFADINSAIVGLGSAPLGDDIASKIRPFGQFKFLAITKGTLAEMSVDASLQSPLGALSLQGTTHLADAVCFDGVVVATALQAGKIISYDMLGATSLTADVNFISSADGVTSSVAGEVTSLAYNSCHYSDLIFNLSYDGSTLESAIASHDPKVDFDLSALLFLGEEYQEYDLTLRVTNADLNALAINRRDSLSRISGSMRVKLGGTSSENLSGSLTLRNVSYEYNEKSIYVPMVAMVARNTDQSKFVELKSDFLDITFNSRSSYKALYDYLSVGLQEYIPMLYTESTERKGGRKVTLADNYSTLNIDFKDTSQICDALLTGLNVANNSSVNIMVNPFSERFSLRLRSDYVEHNDFAATSINLNASNDRDSLSMYATAADLFVGRTVLSSCSLMAGARNNIVQISAGLRDTLSDASVTLGMRAVFEGAQHARIMLLPSHVSVGDQRWMLSANSIVGSGSNLSLNQLAMTNGDQRLSLDGVISKSATDSLVLTLKDYDISMLTSVTRDMGYNVAGLSNGYVNISQILESPRVVASVELDSVSVNKIPSPPLHLSAKWSSTENRAGVYVTNNHTQDTVVTGYYAPLNRRYYAHLQVDSLNMALIDPLLSSTIADTEGYANVDISMQGDDSRSSLHGGIDLYDLKTRVLYTQVEYNLPKGRIEVENNQLSAMAQELYDRDGNRGLLTMRLSLDQLSNVSYMMRIVPENLLVLDTTEEDNELFYGTLYATGVATINGDKRGVNMDITATSQPNSSLIMPLNNKSSVAKTDFITFVERRDDPSELNSTTVNFRRAYMEDRQRRIEEENAAQVNITMAIQATPDLDFQLVIDPVVGDIIKAKGEGRLNLAIAPQDNIFEMYGDYNISEGNYLFTLLNPISKRFVIESGSSIQWTGNPLDPMLNIDAVYKVKTSLDPLISGTSSSSSDYADSESTSSRAVPVDCIIRLGDRLTQPSVEFAIDVPTADTEQQAIISNTLIDQETISQQFFYLMFANSFIPVTTSYGSGLTSSTTASTGFELLTNQLSNWLSSSNYNILIRYRPESDLTSDEIDLGFSRGLINNRLLIEVEGNYLADNKTSIDDSDASNWMTDAYVTWLIDRAGTLRLKGFTQTIDRYDENQGLQETGIGVYYSESFDNFEDLKRKVLDRFRRKKKSKNNNN